MLQTVVSALVQSLTEFLPVSSSGHLAALPALFGWQGRGLAFDVALHIGTLFAVVFYFKGDVWRAICGGIDFLKRKFHTPACRLAVRLGIATVPVLSVGFFFNDLIESHCRTIHVIGTMLIVYGILLYIADRFGKVGASVETMTLSQAFFIGAAQVLALVPGTSRSGVTMTAARALGFSREESARFSMLLSVPTIAAAGAWAFLSMVLNGETGAFSADALTVLTGVGVSCIGGFLAIYFLMKWLKSFSFVVFAVYRILLGTALLFFF